MTSTDQRPFGDVLAAYVSRRKVMTGGAAAAVSTFLAAKGLVGAAPAGAAGAMAPAAEAVAGGAHPSALGFESIPPSTSDIPQVPPGYSWQALVPWGEPIDGSSPVYRSDASNTAEDQRLQLGMGHDGLAYFPRSGGPLGNRDGVLCINHEYTIEEQLFPDGRESWDAEKTEKSMAAHGVSVVRVRQQRHGEWVLKPSYKARRITPDTEMELTGPARGHFLLRTDNDPSGKSPRGTLNNCGAVKTPWNTFLTSEENFNGYFINGHTAPRWLQRQLNERYGVTEFGFGYLWGTTHERFDATASPHEPNTFGWMVEIDPTRPDEPPKKHTALGRFKHEMGEAVIGAGNKAVVYMGDDERFDYLYKFVSAGDYTRIIRRGQSPLEEGTLYVARFDDDGTGEWLPLVHGEGPLTATNGWGTQAEVLIKTRLAADALGATPMDRPEWISADPGSNWVYGCMTNNDDREEPNPPNPRTPNPHGHILRWRDTDGDYLATAFEWDIFLLAGEGLGSGDGSTIPGEVAFGSPDGLGFDRDGRLWIETDGGQPIECNNQMLAADPATGDLRRFFVGPVDCEVTGVTWTPDQRTMFINIQHPGDRAEAANPTLGSSFPDYDNTRPRPATVAITKDDGGVVGT